MSIQDDDQTDRKGSTFPGLGEELRRRRQAAGLSLRQLASKLDVSASFVSQLENGKSQPSVATLYSICNALGATVDELFADAAESTAIAQGPVADRSTRPTSTGNVPPIRTTNGTPTRAHAPIVTPEERSKLVLDTGVTWERLSALRNRSIDFLFVRYDVGGSSTADERLTRHSGIEYGYIISGQLEITLGFDTHLVSAGDAVSFDSELPHRLRNVGDAPVEAIWFVDSRDV